MKREADMREDNGPREEGLDLWFAAAQAEAITPSDLLMARIMKDADAQIAARGPWLPGGIWGGLALAASILCGVLIGDQGLMADPAEDLLIAEYLGEAGNSWMTGG